ncbi:hypothetical protein O0I10_006259 [Lichtheimia ornata]|uniref:F-box domain-containing protein n=1 Tax=Lichtheimia ornata TaxID=688661 RepID=A0AAD7V3L5_9FUNG|nr:uncharacterized protein O0I10_006259 [Lichtheimia ornata]KAJ8657988.1 hypothetical protein O0I10_006259 [Lichtheimia ornata]
MDDSIWEDLCKQPILKASSEKYAKLVYDSTTQLLQPIQSILSALNLRAIGLTKCADFDAALRDAKVMQQLSPFSALGYLCAAEIYSEQGKQLQVINVCNKGLSMTDTMDKQYDDLKRAKMDAEQHQSKRIDFVSQLPVDIVISTLIPIMMDDSAISLKKPNVYLHVSNTWRDRISQSFNGIRFETLSEEGDNLSQVIELAPHIKELDVQQFTRGKWLCDLLRNHDFCSLGELHVGGITADCSDYLVSSLKSIGSTLTHVSIQQEDGSMLSIGDILFNCPHLVSLGIIHPFAPNFSSLRMVKWPNLTRLSFSNTEKDVGCDQIKAIGKRFPSLKVLSLYPCEEIQLTNVVLDTYPRMNQLDFCMDSPAADLTYTEEGPQCSDVGITDISVHVDRSDWEGYHIDPWENLIPILKENHKTIQHFKIDMDFEDDNKDVYDLEYPRLKKLCLFNSGWWIPRNAPILEELTMTSRAIKGNPAVLDTIPPTLKRLELKLGRAAYHLNDETSAVSAYLHRLANHSQLKEVVVHFHDALIISNVLDAIQHLGRIQNLTLIFTRMWGPCVWESYEMDRFVDGLAKGCPRLSSLEINCKNAPSTYTVNALKRLEHLEQLVISIEEMGGDDGFWHALETFKQLKCIRIYSAKAANMDAIRHLQGQRPDLKIIFDKRPHTFNGFLVINPSYGFTV